MSTSPLSDRETPPDEPSRTRAPGRAQAWLIRLRPLFRQTWQNLKVWVPFLLNPADRAREVIYHAREHREGFTWHIHLPRACWRCGREDGLWEREVEIDLRGFEHALSIVGAAVGSAAFFWLLAVLFRSPWMFIFGLVALAIGGALLYAKSWIETVHIEMSTCPEHADAMRLPAVVAHENELHLFLPTDQLSQAARVELRSERLGRDRSLPGAARGTESDVEPPPGRERYQSPYGGTPPRSGDLPPIKLAGDDEEATG